MSTVNWGMLAKSQTDPETIEEAIARIVAEHNADEESHLDTGQSLQSHKAAEIIDHLARSVVRDKLVFDRFTIDEHFASLDIWQKSAGVDLFFISEMQLQTTAVLNNEQYSFIHSGDSMQDQAGKYQNPSWETKVKLDQSTNQTVYVVQGEPSTPDGFGFKIVNGTVYAMYGDEDNVEHLQELSGIIVTNSNIYRCELIDGVSLKFYVNGVLKYTWTGITIANPQVYIQYLIHTDASAIKTMYVHSFHFDADYSS